MVSLPATIPIYLLMAFHHAQFNALNANPSRPQFNRLVSGGVAPGSTLKPLIALAGLDAGVRRPEDRILSTGMFYLPGVNRGWGDSHRGGHGWTDLRKSIAQSVNTYYYKLALNMGIERFTDYMRRYGLGQLTGVDLTGEISGILPSLEYKRKVRKQAWYQGDAVNVSIGQGDWKVSPVETHRSAARLGQWSHEPPALGGGRACRLQQAVAGVAATAITAD